MIPINPTLKLIIGLVIIGALGADQALFKVEPTWTWLETVAQVLAAAELFFTVPGQAAKKLAKIAPLLCLALWLPGCTTQQAIGATPAVATTAACIITTAAADESAGMSAIAVVEDVIAKCGADALTIATVLDAQTKAQIVGTQGDAGAMPAYMAQTQSVAVAAHAMAGAGK